MPVFGAVPRESPFSNTFAIRPEAVEVPDHFEDRDAMAKEETVLMDEHKKRGGGLFLHFGEVHCQSYLNGNHFRVENGRCW